MARNKEANVNNTDWDIDSNASQHFINKKDWCLDFIVDKLGSNSMIFCGGEEYKVSRKGNV